MSGHDREDFIDLTPEKIEELIKDIKRASGAVPVGEIELNHFPPKAQPTDKPKAPRWLRRAKRGKNKRKLKTKMLQAERLGLDVEKKMKTEIYITLTLSDHEAGILRRALKCVNDSDYDELGFESAERDLIEEVSHALLDVQQDFEK